VYNNLFPLMSLRLIFITKTHYYSNDLAVYLKCENYIVACSFLYRTKATNIFREDGEINTDTYDNLSPGMIAFIFINDLEETICFYI
jgi:hypothetical protein